jgi:hypothetical protein
VGGERRGTGGGAGLVLEKESVCMYGREKESVCTGVCITSGVSEAHDMGCIGLVLL